MNLRKEITIILADDHKLVREGLKVLIENNPSMKVIAEASDGHTALQQSKELMPDLIIMDISMPGLNGIEVTRKIIKENSKTKVLALSMHDDQQFVIESLKAGASGYLLKDCTFTELILAINEVIEGRTYLCSVINEVVIKNYIFGEARADSTVFTLLTTREREVLQMMAEGHPTKAIAVQLKVSVKTIESHRQQIMDKLNIHSIAELTKYAIKVGITAL